MSNKQETLEQAAKQYSELIPFVDAITTDNSRLDFEAGAKWQAERMYSDDDVYLTINKIIDGGKDLVKGTTVSRGQAVDYAFDVALKIAKWQAERMYSEEEVKELLIDCKDRFGGSDLDDYVSDEEVNEWFKQIRKA